MPIDTPPKAMTMDELPSASGKESNIQVLINSDDGVKKLSLPDLYRPYQLLIGSYQYYAARFPIENTVPVMGGILDPEDFEDKLVTFKARIPSDWIQSDGSVCLPTIVDRLLQFDPQLALGSTQDDAMQNFLPNLTGGFCSTNCGHGDLNNSGPFSPRGIRYGQHHTGGGGTFLHWDYKPTQGHLRLHTCTRERTVNAFLCIITGPVIAKTSRRYWLIDPEHGEHLFPSGHIDLAISHKGTGIGFNPRFMTDIEPVELKQATLASLYASAQNADPLGLALQLKSRQRFMIHHQIDLNYRSFRIRSHDLVFTTSTTGLKIATKDNHGSLTFTGTPQFSGTAQFGSTYTARYTTTTIEVETRGSTFTVPVSMVTVIFAVKTDYMVLSLTAAGKELHASWWNTFKAHCPSDKKLFFDPLMQYYPPGGIVNVLTDKQGHTVIDSLDAVPRSRFYFHSTQYTPPQPSQSTLASQFASAQNSDALNLYADAHFNLSKYVAPAHRAWMLDGCLIEFVAQKQCIKLIALKNSLYLKINTICQVSTQKKFAQQQKSLVYYVQKTHWSIGQQDDDEITFAHGPTGSIHIVIKEEIIMVSFLNITPEKMQAMIQSAPSHQQELAKKYCESFPHIWSNTLNQDHLGNINGTQESRFYMPTDKNIRNVRQ